MAIRFDPALNREIYRTVHNYNQKRNRAIKRGFTNLPPPLKVSELKARYSSRSALKRDLKNIANFNTSGDEALEVLENHGGARAIKWEFDYLKKNLTAARNFYDREILDASKIDSDMVVAKAEYLNNLKMKRAYLDLDLSVLNQSQFKTFRKTVNEYLYANQRQLQGYRNWMSEVETIMRTLGYDNAQIKEFFSGFEELTPRQFIALYRQSALVSRIYELYIPTKDGSFRLSTSDEDARSLIETFNEEKRDLIEKAKQY